MRTSIVLLLLLAACSDGQSRSTPPADGVPDLEQAAIDSGAIADVSRIDPVGLFQRHHEGGTDALCLIPDGEREYRFGAAAYSGGKSRCTGRGRAKRIGRMLVMRFDKPSRCIMVAQYEGDRIAMAGAVDLECDKLCSERASFAGVTLPRVSGSVEAAYSVRAVDDVPLCSEGKSGT
ncbi:MAG: hypothetical protein JJE34_00715 [Alphaproteobacteria bacterium]|nr:hypothetical protein [Alphaproteobacteria bacterium]